MTTCFVVNRWYDQEDLRGYVPEAIFTSGELARDYATFLEAEQETYPDADEPCTFAVEPWSIDVTIDEFMDTIAPRVIER